MTLSMAECSLVYTVYTFDAGNSGYRGQFASSTVTTKLSADLGRFDELQVKGQSRWGGSWGVEQFGESLIYNCTKK